MDVLRGEETHHIPFSLYAVSMDKCTFEREMREKGICYVQHAQSFEIVQQECSVKKILYKNEKGVEIIRTEYPTPYKTLTLEEVHRPEFYTTVTLKHIFETPDDYKAFQWLVDDMKAVPRYDRAQELVDFLGDDFAVRDQIPLEPLQQLITSFNMDIMTFSIEWYDNRDEILKLYSSFRELNRSVYDIVAGGPLEFMNYGGNVVPAIIGPQNFADYFVSNYNEAAEIVHKKGKLIGTHLDDNNAIIMEEIGKADLDYIEAYDPEISPPLDVAFKAFKDKTIWINWPTPWHHAKEDEIIGLTQGLISQKRENDRLLIGILENLPIGRERTVIPLILKAITDMGR
jgi:hypothetical protein